MNKRSIVIENNEKCSKRARLEKDIIDIVSSSDDSIIEIDENYQQTTTYPVLPVELWHEVISFLGDDDRTLNRLTSCSRWTRLLMNVSCWRSMQERKRKWKAIGIIMHRLAQYGLVWLPKLLKLFNGVITGSLPHQAYFDEEWAYTEIKVYFFNCNQNDEKTVKLFFDLFKWKKTSSFDLKLIFANAIEKYSLDYLLELYSRHFYDSIYFNGKIVQYTNTYKVLLKYGGNKASPVLIE